MLESKAASGSQNLPLEATLGMEGNSLWEEILMEFLRCKGVTMLSMSLPRAQESIFSDAKSLLNKQADP